ncbi:IGFBP N-terminal domain-containing protein [Nephila pilipes]|uniref:IGFBP N-terminal domain-containing protein n=1 Tax=Nephila pilipes TaxID=299642 RepID=A0A8X6QXG3_NEPPI|nr:IGFBP N-terminal domain-containing protein [Nephila pilipes]
MIKYKQPRYQILFICVTVGVIMRTVFCLVVIIAVIAGCLALDCPDCDIEMCRDPGTCRLGKTTDICGCCPVCFKGIGEECGGPWDAYGKCANHLSCIRIPGRERNDPVGDFNAVGRCYALP